VDGGEEQLRAALREIERLMAEASESGESVEKWVEQFVDELRAAFPEQTDTSHIELADRILSDPRGSIVAQARIDPATLRTLKDIIAAGNS
jgi:hypothetical protein